MRNPQWSLGPERESRHRAILNVKLKRSVRRGPELGGAWSLQLIAPVRGSCGVSLLHGLCGLGQGNAGQDASSITHREFHREIGIPLRVIFPAQKVGRKLRNIYFAVL